MEEDKAKLMSQYGLKHEVLQQKCSEEHLYEMEKFISVQEVGYHLPKIGTVDLKDIEDDYKEAARGRRRLVRLWVERNGDKANYDSMITAMIKAEKLDQATDVCKLLSSKPDKRKQQSAELDFSPLMEACRVGNVRLAKVYLDKGADPNLANSEGWTALMAAANNGQYDIVDLLLLRGANPDMQDESGWSALMAAVYKKYADVALRLVKAGATPHIQDKNKTNALLLAIAKHETDDVVQALLNNNPELDIQDSYGETALIFACKKSNLRLVKRLLSMGANPNLQNNFGEPPIMIASRKEDVEIAEALIESGAILNTTGGAASPLMVACNMGSEEMADLLVSHGADPKQADERGITAIDIAKNMNHTELAKKLDPTNQETSTKPTGIFQITMSTLSALQNHLSIGPLFLDPDSKPGVASYGLQLIGGVLENIIQ